MTSCKPQGPDKSSAPDSSGSSNCLDTLPSTASSNCAAGCSGYCFQAFPECSKHLGLSVDRPVCTNAGPWWRLPYDPSSYPCCCKTPAGRSPYCLYSDL